MTDVTDTALRQLAIHYATVNKISVSSGNTSEEIFEAMWAAWQTWPSDMWERFQTIIHDAHAQGNDFWTEPARLNAEFGIKLNN